MGFNCGPFEKKSEGFFGLRGDKFGEKWSVSSKKSNTFAMFGERFLNFEL